VNYPEPLVVTNHMEKHCNLLLNITTSFWNKASTSKKIAKSKKKKKNDLVIPKKHKNKEIKNGWGVFSLLFLF